MSPYITLNTHQCSHIIRHISFTLPPTWVDANLKTNIVESDVKEVSKIFKPLTNKYFNLACLIHKAGFIAIFFLSPFHIVLSVSARVHNVSIPEVSRI